MSNQIMSSVCETTLMTIFLTSGYNMLWLCNIAKLGYKKSGFHKMW